MGRSRIPGHPGQHRKISSQKKRKKKVVILICLGNNDKKIKLYMLSTNAGFFFSQICSIHVCGTSGYRGLTVFSPLYISISHNLCPTSSTNECKGGGKGTQ